MLKKISGYSAASWPAHAPNSLSSGAGSPSAAASSSHTNEQEKPDADPLPRASKSEQYTPAAKRSYSSEELKNFVSLQQRRDTPAIASKAMHPHANADDMSRSTVCSARSLQGADNTERPTSSAPVQHETAGTAIPHPSMLRDADWGKLDPDLAPFVKARFSQELINTSYGIKPIAICTGLAIQWLKLCDNESSQRMHENQVQRMLNLSSFDNMVHSKITFGFYKFEHKSNMAAAEARYDIKELMMAGGRSVLSAAEMAGLGLCPVLRDHDGNEAFGKIVVAGYSTNLDPSAVAEVAEHMHEGDCGVAALMGNEGSHALAYAVRDGSIHLFDPNYGEFQFEPNDFFQVVNAINNSTGLDLVAMQLFKS